MSYSPTTVSRLEATLCKHGHKSNGVTTLDPNANDDGHLWYPDALTMMLGGTSVDFFDRYSDGTAVPKAEQVRRIGNSVVPIMARRIVAANVAA